MVVLKKSKKLSGRVKIFLEFLNEQIPPESRVLDENLYSRKKNENPGFVLEDLQEVLDQDKKTAGGADLITYKMIESLSTAPKFELVALYNNLNVQFYPRTGYQTDESKLLNQTLNRQSNLPLAHCTLNGTKYISNLKLAAYTGL